MLRDDVLDLAYLSVTERIESHGLGLHQLVSEELVVILPRSHPLAKRSGVRMRELAGEQFISYREGSRLRELLNRAAHEAEFDPQVMLESNESRRIRRLVARGMGVAILPRSDTEGSGGGCDRGEPRPARADARHHARLAPGPTSPSRGGRVHRAVARPVLRFGLVNRPPERRPAQ